MLRRVAYLLATSIFLSAQCASVAQAQPPDEAQIRQWIGELANTSPVRRFESPADRLTAEEKARLEPVEAAYKKLTQHFIVALPLLVQSIGDRRFSYPQEHPSSGVFENRTVGDACRSIIQRKILPRNPAVIDDRDIAVWREIPIEEWYARSKGKDLFEMQVAALDWLLQQPPPARVSVEQWEKELVELRAYRDDFVAKRKPVDETFGPPIEGK